METEVLRILWNSPHPLTPREVQVRLRDQLAYTTVTTVLTRLWDKGLAEREPARRGFAYQPTVTEPDLASRRFGELLDSTSDRNATLAGFVGHLDDDDRKAIRDLLDRLDPES